MTAAYWNQWDHVELLSLHGIEDDTESYQNECDTELYLYECDCGRCNECLDLSR